MDCKKIKTLLIDYADRNLSKENTSLVQEHLKSCKDCSQEVEELVVLLSEINKTEDEQPSAQLRSNFLNTLEQEKSKSQIKPLEPKVIQMSNSTSNVRFMNPVYQMAAGFAILIAGVFIGLLVNKNNGSNPTELASLQNEVSSMKQVVMLSQLKQQSPSSRIQAVGYVEEITEADPEVLTALIKTMNTDDNSTVRLAATNALSRFSKDESVRTALINALATEKNPMVQISLINIMIELHEKKATNFIKRIAEDSDVNKSVKAFARKGLEILI